MSEKLLHEGLRRLSVAHFLTALTAMLVALPFLDQIRFGDLIETMLVTVVLLSAVSAVGGRRRTLIIAAILVAPAVTIKWVDHFWPDALPKSVLLGTGIIFIGYIVGTLMIFIFRAPQVDAEVLCAAVAAFLMMGLLWAFAYELAERLEPHSFLFTTGADAGRQFDAIEALYFSFGTLTNYYGDIIPVTRLARTLAMAQATAGLFYMALLISRLVSLYSGTQ